MFTPYSTVFQLYQEYDRVILKAVEILFEVDKISTYSGSGTVGPVGQQARASHIDLPGHLLAARLSARVIATLVVPIYSLCLTILRHMDPGSQSVLKLKEHLN